MLCRFCCIRPSSVDAHIIPRSFFVEHADDRYPSQEITNLENVFPEKRPIGVYDKDILCDICEPLFSSADDYGYRFFHPSVDYSLKTDGQGTYTYLIERVDYEQLKRFLLTILWRASVSTRKFYAAVNLGIHEEKIRDLLRLCNPGMPDDYSVYIERFDYPSNLVPIFGPLEVAFADVEMYLFILNGFLVHIKVDEKPLPQEVRAIMLRPGQPLIVPQVPYKGSQEYEINLNTLRDAYKRT